ncbi:MAG TPA: ShlB/FhaC/HecB family hemolysin secretion/activation protein [Stellaceae bacterium]|nr:ShlB/FhaC/HecB family hemolysin secretion/activation protein [Stellaceae bacterium]
MRISIKSGVGRRIARALTALALLLVPVRAGFAQAVDIAPFVTPPVQKVTPPPTPEVLAPVLPATPPPEEIPSGPPVRVDDVRVEGVTVYDPATLRPLYADLIGATVPREKLLAAVEALQTRYREDGYILTTVHGAAERRGGGLIFVIRATEGYISDVKLDGDIGDAGKLALAMLEHLTSIRPVNNADLERYLLLANDIPGVSAQAVLRRVSPEPGAVELVAKVARTPFAAQFQFDNRGSPEVGPYEALLTAQSNAFTSVGEQIQGTFFNTFNREQLFGQVDVSGFLNSEGLKLRGYAGRGNTQPGGALTGTGFNADLQIAGVGLSYPVIRTRRLNLSVDGSFDAYDGVIDTFAAAGMLSDTHLRILRLGGALDFQDAVVAGLPAANSIILKVSQGLPAFGASSNNQALPARVGERNNFSKVTGEMTRVQNLIAIGDAQTAIKASVGGQFTDDILPPSEQYLLGGTRFGRGFFAGEVAGDRALGATVELQLNTGFDNLSPLSPDHRLNVQFYNFFDYGRTYNLIPGSIDQTIDSIGIGARSDVTPWMFVELEGLHRFTTHPDGANAPKLANEAIFTRIVLRY